MLVRRVLPVDFLWHERESPLRYQAVSDQSLQSLRAATATTLRGQSVYAFFDAVRVRRSGGDDFELQLFVYGTWLRLVKQQLVELVSDSVLSAPDQLVAPGITVAEARKMLVANKEARARDNPATGANVHTSMGAKSAHPPSAPSINDVFGSIVSAAATATAGRTDEVAKAIQGYDFLLKNNPTLAQSMNRSERQTTMKMAQSTQPTLQSQQTGSVSASSPIQTLTLEMKVNGVMIPVEISKRSFLTALSYCNVSWTDTNLPGNLSQ